MKLQYETGIATLIQFITLSLLGIANGADSIVTTCHAHGSDCVSNLIVSILFFILTAVWFGAVWILGYGVQERRSHRLAYALIGIESMVLLVATFNAKHHTNLLSLVTSLLDIGLALWIMLLAFRLIRAKGGRIVKSGRSRQRKHTI